MPNWAFNSIKLNDKKDYEDLKKRFVSKDEKEEKFLDFQKIRPAIEPTDIEKDNRWYHDRCERWGTKWNSVSCEFFDDNLQIRFDTAWNPPVPIIKELAKLYDLEAWADEEQTTEIFYHLRSENGEIVEEDDETSYYGLMRCAREYDVVNNVLLSQITKLLQSYGKLTPELSDDFDDMCENRDYDLTEFKPHEFVDKIKEKIKKHNVVLPKDMNQDLKELLEAYDETSIYY